MSERYKETRADYPRYAFNYAINDPITRDNKAQWEARDGDVVKGAYSLREPDGTIRVVEYSANDISGFNALVKKIGPNFHPITVLTKTSHGVVPIIPLAPIKVNPISISSIETDLPIADVKLNYGFGAAPLAIGLPKVTALGHWSLPWDPVTGSYGGWVPIDGPVPRGPYATVYSKKYINGKLHEWSTGPIPLNGKKLVIKTKH
ncbi:unnamed protein product, partial [Iphiclides podalirius]